jgi:hypothetical protein
MVIATSPNQRFTEIPMMTVLATNLLNPSRTKKPPYTTLEVETRKRIEKPEQIDSLLEEVGPCPRDIIAFLTDQADYERRLRDAFSVYDDIKTMLPLVRAPAELSNKQSHSIVLVRRIGPVLEHVFKNDNCSVSFKTRATYQHVMKRFSALRLDQAKQLFEDCTRIGTHGAVFAGHLVFVGLAIRYTSGEFPEDKVLGLFAPMVKAETDGIEFPIRYTHRTLSHNMTVVVNGDRTMFLRILPADAPKQLEALRDDQHGQRMPWSSRERFVYVKDKEEALLVDNSRYYHPGAHNNPLFDAFFYQVLEDKVIVWVLQMTIKRDHNGSNKGFPIIKKLMERAERAQPGLSIEVKYVLVVPYSQPGWDVEWNFDADFIKGDVFVQQVNV